MGDDITQQITSTLLSAEEHVRWAREIQVSCDHPDIWYHYIQFMTTRVQSLVTDATVANRHLGRLYHQAIQAISVSEHSRSPSLARLMINQALLKGPVESGVLLRQARAHLRKFAIIHIASAQLELNLGNKDKCIKLLMKGKSLSAEPETLLTKAINNAHADHSPLIEPSEYDMASSPSAYNFTGNTGISITSFDMSDTFNSTHPSDTSITAPSFTSISFIGGVRRDASNTTRSNITAPFDPPPVPAPASCSKPVLRNFHSTPDVKHHTAEMAKNHLSHSQASTRSVLQGDPKESVPTNDDHPHSLTSTCSPPPQRPVLWTDSQKLDELCSEKKAPRRPLQELPVTDHSMSNRWSSTNKSQSAMKVPLKASLLPSRVPNTCTKRLNLGTDRSTSKFAPGRVRANITEQLRDLKLEAPKSPTNTDHLSISGQSNVPDIPDENHRVIAQSNDPEGDEKWRKSDLMTITEKTEGSNLRSDGSFSKTDVNISQVDDVTSRHRPSSTPSITEDRAKSHDRGVGYKTGENLTRESATRLDDNYTKAGETEVDTHKTIHHQKVEIHEKAENSSNQHMRNNVDNFSKHPKVTPKYNDANLEEMKDKPRTDVRKFMDSLEQRKENIDVPNKDPVVIAKPMPLPTPSVKPTPVLHSTREPLPSTTQQKRHDPFQTMTIKNKVYYIQCLRGKGGSSKVYQGIDIQTKTTVAIKVVDLSSADEFTVEGYKNEVNFLERLQYSDNIIKLYSHEYDDEKNQLSIVMEYGSTDLASVIKNVRKSNNMTDNMLRHYWESLLRAVKVIHNEGIIHSDLKPANFILVNEKLKLIDFGIAKAMAPDVTSIELENTMGTLNYISPEAITMNTGNNVKSAKVGTKSDVWSLGCILYNIVYGRTPFAKLRHQYMIIQAILNPEFAIEFTPIPDKDLLDVMKKCLTHNPKERPSIDELLAHPYITQIHKKPANSDMKRLLEQMAMASPNTLSQIQGYSNLLLEKKSGSKPTLSYD